jgi:hypothetical protein
LLTKSSIAWVTLLCSSGSMTAGTLVLLLLMRGSRYADAAGHAQMRAPMGRR